MKTYLKRLLYTAVAFTIMLVIILLVRFFVDKSDETLSLFEFIGNSISPKVIGVFIALILLYPFYGFGKKKRHLSKDYAFNKEAIEELMGSLGYIKKFEDDVKVVFNKEKLAARINNFFLDEIEIKINDNPIVFNGRRRELMKINRRLDDSLL